MNVIRRIALVAIAILALVPLPSALAVNPLTPGDIFVYRVGDGSVALSANAAPVFIEERNPTTGAIVQTIAMPIAVSGPNRRLTAAGNATSEGYLSVATNGQYVVVTGYDADVATAAIAGTTSSTVNRVIGRISMAGAIDTTTALNTFSGGNIRSATSLDGSSFWAVGSNTGEVYANLGGSGLTTVASTTTNLRVTNVFGAQLYASSASGSLRLGTVGAGTPTTSGNTITNLPGFPITGSPESFFFADVDGSPGIDTVYVADTGGTIQKYSLVAGSWVAKGTLSAAGVSGITGSVSGTSVTLWGTSGSTLYTVTDASGFNATITGTVNTLSPSAGANTAFRGVAILQAGQGVVPLSGTGAATPSSVLSGDTTLLTVSVTPGTSPPSTGITVTGDLSSIGGSATQTFFDNGTNGDQTPGDNVFSFSTTATGSVGPKSLPISIADAQARNASTNISLNIVTLTAIHDIQGNGDTSPLVGQTVTTRGVVTGVRSNGYFIELPDAQWDADPNTSEGIFVFTSSTPPAAATVGNMVQVTGTVSEFIPSSDPNSPSQTELISPTTSLLSSGNPMPTAITITTTDTNPAGTIRQLEKYAAMRVHVNTLNVVGPSGGTINEANATSASNGTFYGVLPTIARPFREPGIQAPDPIPNPPCCIPRFDLNPERIRVNSIAVGGSVIDVTAGATVTNITGPLDYGFRAYTIDVEPATVPGVSGNVTFTPVPARTATEFTVGCQNMERFFDNVADGNGAVTLTTTAYNNRLNKASLLIRNVLLMPDILGLSEMETAAGITNLANKVNADAIAAAQPNPNYTGYLQNGNDIGGINVGFLVNSTRITVNNVAQAPGSLTATYTDPTTNSPALIWDRPPLVLDATVIGPPAVPIIVVVNHLRSLSGVDDTTVSGLSTNGDRVRQKRRAGAEWLANYIQGRLTANPNERLVLVGDFNAFEFNDGYVDVMGTIKGTPTASANVLLSSSDLVNPNLVNLIDSDAPLTRYSYNFDGDAQVLDHTLLSPGAVMNFSRFVHGRVDADFPEAFRNDSTRPERLSDHDGEVTYFSLTPTAHFDVSIPSGVTAGSAFDGTVTVRDALGNIVTNYTGTVHFTSSDGSATKPPDYGFTGGDAGVHTFSGAFILNAAGAQSVTATDTPGGSITGTGNTTVTCEGPATITGASSVCTNSAGNTASGPGGMTSYTWGITNGTITSATNIQNITYTAGSAGTVTLSLTVTNPSGCIASSSAPVTINPIPPTPTITPGGPTTFTWGGNVTLTSSSATGYQWYLDTGSGPSAISLATNQSYMATVAGNYTVVVTDGIGCGSAPSAATTVVVNKATPTVIATGGTFTYDGNPKAGSGSATGGAGESLTITSLTYNGTGSTTYGPSTTAPSLAGTYTVTAHTDGDANNNPGDSAATALTINKFNPLMAAHGGTVTYDGNPHAGTGQAFGGAGEILPVTLTYQGISGTTYGPSATPPTNVGIYLVTAHTVGDANNNAFDSLPNALRINKATATITAPVSTFTYNGNPHPANASATGGGGESLAITVTYTGTGSTTYGPTTTAPSLAGTYTYTVHTDGDANNNGGDSAATALTINKFNPLMAAHGGTFTYSGTPHAATGQAFGGAGEVLPVTLTYQGISGTTYGPSATPPTNVGIYLATAHTVGDANNNAFDSLPNAVRINKATATIAVTAYCVDFDGAAHTAAGTATGVLSEALTGLNVSGTTHTAAGTYTGDAWIFTDVTGNYNNANGTVNDSIVNAVISASPSTITGSAGNVASVANAGAGATYNWSITNGSITAGTGTNSITFTAGAVGTLTLQITVTTSAGCGKTKSANVTVVPPLTITSVVPPSGLVTGGKSVTVNGTGFVSGATITFGGNAATNVVFVNSTKLTAKTPAHAGGAVNVTVTNPDTSTATLTNGYTYVPQQFDANGDHVIDASDIFYLVNFLFLGGPPPAGASGMDSGDANGDGVVDPADIFYLISYLYLHGPAPMSEPGGSVAAQSVGRSFTGSVTLGDPVRTGSRVIVPVMVTTPEGGEAAQALSLRVVFHGGAANATIRRAGAARAMEPTFEISRPSAGALSYLLSFDNARLSGTVAEIEYDAADDGRVAIDVDPSTTLLSNAAGTRKATVAMGTLQVNGVESEPARPERKE